ncbi:MAG: hypothetical protein HRU11_10655, partial [Parvularculaceae bacterium]|nr:hypothetical protein [Parvularculaceae bacterium]
MIRSFQGLAFYPIVLGCSAAPLPYQASEVDLCAAIAVVDGVLGSDLNIEQSAAQFDALKKRSDLSSPVSALNVVCDNNLTGARPGLGLVGSGVDQVSFSRD